MHSLILVFFILFGFQPDIIETYSAQDRERAVVQAKRHLEECRTGKIESIISLTDLLSWFGLTDTEIEAKPKEIQGYWRIYRLHEARGYLKECRQKNLSNSLILFNIVEEYHLTSNELGSQKNEVQYYAKKAALRLVKQYLKECRTGDFLMAITLRHVSQNYGLRPNETGEKPGEIDGYVDKFYKEYDLPRPR